MAQIVTAPIQIVTRAQAQRNIEVQTEVVDKFERSACTRYLRARCEHCAQSKRRRGALEQERSQDKQKSDEQEPERGNQQEAPKGGLVLAKVYFESLKALLES